MRSWRWISGYIKRIALPGVYEQSLNPFSQLYPTCLLLNLTHTSLPLIAEPRRGKCSTRGAGVRRIEPMSPTERVDHFKGHTGLIRKGETRGDVNVEKQALPLCRIPPHTESGSIPIFKTVRKHGPRLAQANGMSPESPRMIAFPAMRRSCLVVGRRASVAAAPVSGRKSMSWPSGKTWKSKD